MRPLAVSSAKRSSFYPDLPTVDEAGVPGYQSVSWYGLVGPKGMSPGLLNKIAEEAVRAGRDRGRQVRRRATGRGHGGEHASRVRFFRRGGAQSL